MSLPCHQPEKWNGMKAWSGPTPSVIFAVTLSRAPVGVLTHTCSPLRMPRSAAALGLISTKFSCISSGNPGVELARVLRNVLARPRVGARPRPAALVLDQAPAGENDGEVLADVLVLLLHRLVQRRQPPQDLDVVVSRILVDQIRADAVERLAVLRDVRGGVPHTPGRAA